jgi:hypothetical protein
VVLAASAVAGCTAAPSIEDPSQQTEEAGVESNQPILAAPSGPTDSGDFVLSIRQGGSYTPYEQSLRQSEFLRGIVDHLNSLLALEEDIPIHVRECGTPNAFYDSSTRTVTLCYDLMADTAARFAEVELSSTEYQEAMSGAMTFILLHEIGHALIDVYDAPSTGREEDAADNFATLLLLAQGYDGAKSVAFAAGFWATRIGSTPAWDEHSLDEQRVYNLLCYLYGSDPEAYASIVPSEVLPQERAERCPDEYAKIRSAWLRDVEAHLLISLEEAGDVRGPRTAPFPPAPPINHVIESGKAYVVAAQTTGRREFSLPKAGEVSFNVARADSSTMDVGIIRAADFSAYESGQQVTAWGYHRDVGQASGTYPLGAGTYALVIRCNNSFADCDGQFSLRATY